MFTTVVGVVATVVDLVVLVLLVHAPVVGPALRVLAAMLGIGLVTDHLRALWERRTAPAPAV